MRALTIDDAACRSGWDAEHNDEGVEEALEQRRHQQVGNDEGEDEVPLK